MFWFVFNIVFFVIVIIGWGSFGVGFIVVVIIDKDMGECWFEVGVMVFVDCGVVCIDEFDKMFEIDWVVIYEVME